MRQLHGSCLCGAVTYRVPDQFIFAGNCHCSQCRKWSGAAYLPGAMVEEDELEILTGEGAITTYPKTDETDLGFCRHCGSSLYSHKKAMGKYVIRLGTLDDQPTQTPDRHIFVGSKAHWHRITDDLPQYETRP